MRRRHKWIGIAAIVVVVTVAAFQAYSTSGWYITRLYGFRGLRTVNHATQVVAYRVDGPWPRFLANNATSRESATSPAIDEKLLGMNVLRPPVELNDAQAARLRALLNDPHTYGHGFVSACTFHPDVAYQFTRDGADDVVVVLCFHCDDLHVHVGSAEYRLDSFDARRPAMLELVKECFRDDSYIQQFSPRSPFQH
jgi:hypothetical protein